MKNALIFSPDFDGHRQVYVFVIEHVLNELGFNIYIAGNIKQLYANSFYIDRLKKSQRSKIIDTSKYSDGGNSISSTEFIELQNECDADLTIFAEADNHIHLLVSQIGNKQNKFRGILIGIFLRPFHYYEKIGLLNKLRHLKHLPSRWRIDEKLFHEYFLKQFSLLQVPLYIDENFVAHHKKCQWLPDVFQEYADLIIHDEKPEQREWIAKLNKFKEKNTGRFIFLYFGTAQYRRGYDILLKMAEDNEGCFIHCGLRNNKEYFEYDVNAIRSSLNNKGCLFETDQYIEDPFCVEHFFRSISHLVMPYRNFFGSSGVMLQALGFKIPILAPENGLIGYRIKKYQLGITYNEKNPTSLYTQFEFFKNLDPKTFENKIIYYMNYQSTEQLKKVLVSSFTFTDKPLRQHYLTKP
jgi:hypothetical protein